jgi:hypothetical protein
MPHMLAKKNSGLAFSVVLANFSFSNINITCFWGQNNCKTTWDYGTHWGLHEDYILAPPSFPIFPVADENVEVKLRTLLFPIVHYGSTFIPHFPHRKYYFKNSPDLEVWKSAYIYAQYLRDGCGSNQGKPNTRIY